MQLNVSRTLPTLAALLALGLLPASPAAAAQAESDSIATERLSPTGLTLEPRIDYEAATLRIVGPEGYEVRKRFAGGVALTADLLTDRAPGVSGQQVEGKRSVSAPAAPQSPAIPDGRYRYEAVLVDASGEQKVVSGLFFVEGGVAISREAKRAQLGGIQEDLAARRREGRTTAVTEEAMTPLTAPVYAADDGLGAVDTANDGDTFLFLDSDSPTDDAYWQLFNDNGDLNIAEGTAFLNTSRMLFDRGTGNVGIGTQAPGRRLHVQGVNPQMRLSDFYTNQMDLSVGGTGLWFLDDDGDYIAQFNHSAPENRLVVTGAGVGIDTQTPGGNLHISGGAGADVFNAVGPDPSIGGNALNFGYSGFTFGSGSGFFNVRPGGASAINPALYFATGNIDRMLIDNQGFLGVHLDGVLGPGFNPAHPIHAQTSGAHLTAAGVWTNASSRELKEAIAPLDTKAALEALAELEPVSFRYKVEPEDGRVGFIAEEVPELVANPDRKTLSPMDIVAVLTRVVQEQQATIDALLVRVEELEKTRE